MGDFRDEGIFSTDQIAALEEMGIHSPYVVLEDQQLRIEALRAASRIVAGEKSNAQGGGRTPADIIGLAEQFAKWLEDGEI